MSDRLEVLLSLVGEKNAMHGKKLRKSLPLDEDVYQAFASRFLERHREFLERQGISLEQAVDCYLHYSNQILYEQIQFMRSGEYSCKSFQDAYQNVYGKPDVMDWYLNGLFLTQVLWRHHYEIFQYFLQVMEHYRPHTRSYLEVGVGHGAFLAEAVDIFGPECRLEALDVSAKALELVRLLLPQARVDLHHVDICTYRTDARFDQIVMGEVLEHVEKPKELLGRLREMLEPSGRLFLTTPINAPAEDHIILFSRPEELHQLYRASGWKVEQETLVCSEAMPIEEAVRRKIPIMWAGVLTPEAH